MIEDYEHNLKLYNESIRKDLDIILSSTIPIQKNLMKTLLWINSVVIGLLTSLMKYDLKNTFIILSISIPYTFSFMAIMILLISLKDGRVKAFGTPSMNSLEDIEPNKWAKSQGLANINHSLKKAFDINSVIVIKRGERIARAVNFTILSVIFIFLITILHTNLILTKGGNTMSENKKDTNFDDRPKMSSSTIKPELMLATNNSNVTLDNVRAGLEEGLFDVESRVKNKDSNGTKSKED